MDLTTLSDDQIHGFEAVTMGDPASIEMTEIGIASPKPEEKVGHPFLNLYNEYPKIRKIDELLSIFMP